MDDNDTVRGIMKGSVKMRHVIFFVVVVTNSVDEIKLNLN